MGSLLPVPRPTLFAALLTATLIGSGLAQDAPEPAAGPNLEAGASAEPGAEDTGEPLGLAPEGTELQPGAVRAVNPQDARSGALPFPEPAPGSGSDVPKSIVFYILPVIGLWLILRRRSRSVHH